MNQHIHSSGDLREAERIEVPERRESLRVDASLPFAWRAFNHEPNAVELYGCFGLSMPRGELALDAAMIDDFRQAVNNVDDACVRNALHLLAARVERVEKSLHSAAEAPGVQLVQLGLQGISFHSDTWLEERSWVGVHVLLESNIPIVCSGRVARCTTVDEGGFRVAASLEHLDGNTSRRLTRFVLEEDLRQNG